VKIVSDYSFRKISRLSFVLAVLVVFLHSRVAQDCFASLFFCCHQEFVCQGVIRVAVLFFCYLGVSDREIYTCIQKIVV
jgi:hypothetical protein